MKIPPNKKIIAVVNKNKPRFSAMDLFDLKDKNTFVISKDEVKCIIEIKFIKWLK